VRAIDRVLALYEDMDDWDTDDTITAGMVREAAKGGAVRKPKLTYWIRWHADSYLTRHRTRKPVRIGFPIYKKGNYLGIVEAMGWEGDRFVLDMG